MGNCVNRCINKKENGHISKMAASRSNTQPSSEYFSFRTLIILLSKWKRPNNISKENCK